MEVILIPLMIFRGMTLNRNDTRAIVFLCLLGVLTVTVTSARTIIMTVADEWNPGLLQTSEILAFAECCAALIACCLPSVRAHVNARLERRRRDERAMEVGRAGKKRWFWDSSALDRTTGTDSTAERVEYV
jgi:hypothetical protein